MYLSIQACRAAAALLVVLFHLGGVIALEKYFDLESFSVPFSFGHGGVNFFFVLSGFIIFKVHRLDFGVPMRLRAYLLKRAIRIYPVYWLIFLAVFGVAWLSPSLREDLPTDALSLLKALTLIPQDVVVVGGTGAPVLSVAWSLQYELMFYALVGLAIIHPLLAGLALFFMVVPAWLGHGFPWTFVASTYLLHFLLGVATALLCASRWRPAHPLRCAMAGVVIFLIYGLLSLQLPAKSLWSDWLGLLGFGGGSALIIVGLVRAEDEGRVIGAQPIIQLMGNASYALYLLHFPLVSVGCKVAVAAGLQGWAGAIITYCLTLMMCLVAAVVFHSYVEQPLLRRLLSHLR